MKLLIIITGSIAAKKNIEIIKNLNNNGFKIDCIVTDSAKKLINLNLLKKIISGKIFYNSSEFKNKMLHIKLTRKSDLILICPATANIIAKFANGYADDLASTSIIATDKKIFVIPAMNREMWNNKINQENIKKLAKNGVEFIGPIYGKLSCGEVGLGRISKSEDIIDKILDEKKRTNLLKNMKCIITAGPTIESIDPIRFISNHSSGKQGYEIANQLSLYGANVILISGPTNLQNPPNVRKIDIKTANEMNTKVLQNIDNCQIAIFTAAVSDIRPNTKNKNKIKKEKLNKINLIKNPDIISNVCKLKKDKPKMIIGFAAETEKLVQNATKKLKNKGCNWIIANQITKKEKIFGSDYNKVIIIKPDKIIKFKRMTKINLAKKIVKNIFEELKVN